MNKAVLFGIGGVVALGGAWLLLGPSSESGSGEATHYAAGSSAAKDSGGAFHARDAGSTAAGPNAVGGAARPAGSQSASAGAPGTERDARLQPAHLPGGNGAGPGDADAPIVADLTAPSDAIANGSTGSGGGAVGARLAPHNAPRNDTSEAASGQPAAVPAQALPDMAYDSGVDKHFDTQTRVEAPDTGKIGGPTGAVSMWIKPGWEAGNQEDATLVELGDSSLRMAKNVDFMRFEYINPDGKEQGLGFNIADWKQGDWHQLTGTWNNGQYYLYADGKLVSQNVFVKPPDFQPDTKVYVGTQNANGVPGAPGDISGVQVMNRWLSTTEIQQQFTNGARPR